MRLARGVHDHEQVVVGAREHQIVEDSARVVGEEGVALPPRRQIEHVHGKERLERGRGAQGQARLPHVRNVEQARSRSSMPVLGENSGGKLHRHVVPGEGHHARAQPDVERM